MTTHWGLLGPEFIPAERRRRTLGLTRVVRSFNELAVPGTGGVWFAKQLVLALLGVALAEKARSAGKQLNNIEVANAVEAVACWGALMDNNWAAEPRLRGRLKLYGKDDLSFARVRKPGFYVSLPMRMRTVESLRVLGLVEGSRRRFNSYRCTPTGRDLVSIAFKDHRPKNRTLLDNLLHWIKGDAACIHTPQCMTALSPVTSLPQEARDLLRDCIVRDGPRRRSALQWVDELLNEVETTFPWERRPDCFSADHWRDIHCGALFSNTRDLAYEVLDEVAKLLVQQTSQRLRLTEKPPTHVLELLGGLQKSAGLFLRQDYDPSPEQAASTFCRECRVSRPDDVLRSLVCRDDWVLRTRDDFIVPGPGFRPDRLDVAMSGTAQTDEDAGSKTTGIPWPDGISSRISNLFLLNADLRGDLDRWLRSVDEEATDD